MKVNVKHIIEIAGGLVVGNLIGRAVNGVINATEKGVKNLKNKKQEKEA